MAIARSVDTMQSVGNTGHGCYAHGEVSLERSATMFTMTRTNESTASSPCLLLAFELGQRSWKLGFTVGLGQRARIRQIPAGALAVMMTEIERAKKYLRLPAEAEGVSCYEAG